VTDLIARLRAATEEAEADDRAEILVHQNVLRALLDLLDSEPSRIRAAVGGEREACAGCADLEAFHAGAVWAVTSDDVRLRNAARVEIANQIASTIRARTP